MGPTTNEYVARFRNYGHQHDTDLDRGETQARQYHAYRPPELVLNHHRWLDRRNGLGNLGEVRSGRICEAVREDVTELPPATVTEG